MLFLSTEVRIPEIQKHEAGGSTEASENIYKKNICNTRQQNQSTALGGRWGTNNGLLTPSKSMPLGSFFSACEQDGGPQGLPKAPFFKSLLNGVGPPGTSKDNCFSSSLWMGLGHRCLGCSWGLPNDVLRSRFAGLRGLRPRLFF